MIDVRRGDRVTASIRGVNADVVVQFLVNITPDPFQEDGVLVPGEPYTLEILVTDADGDRTISSVNDDTGNISSDGVITSATARVFSGTAPSQPGELWSELDLRRNSLTIANMAFGYQYGGHPVSYPNAPLDGPLDGPGRWIWVQEADDIAGNVIDITNLAATNTRRIVRAILIKYHQVGGATATITATIRDLVTAVGPTNWSIESDTWTSPGLALGANEEGLMHIGENGFLSTNDAGTLAYADITTAPNPLPLVLGPADTVDLLVAAASGAAGDDYDVWVLYEEWIVI